MFIISILFFTLPFINFLNKINLPQISNSDYFWIFNFYLIIFIIFSFLYLCIRKYKKNYTYYLFIFPLLFFLSFFYKDIYNSLGLSFFILLNTTVIIAYLFLIKKFFNNLLIFLYFFFFLNFSLFSFNLINYFSDLKNHNSILQYEAKYNDNSEFDNNFYLILLDSMININDYESIFSEKFEVDDYKNDNYFHIKKLYSSYNTTYAALTSLFASNYIVDENSKYSNFENFFPRNFDKNINNSFLTFLKSADYEFIHFGNRFYPDEITKHSYKKYFKKNHYLGKLFNNNFFFFFEKSYFDGVYKKLFKRIDYDLDDGLENFVNFSDNLEVNYKRKFFLIHHLYPHYPYIFDRNCNKYKSSTGNYKLNYNCTLKDVSEFINFIDSKDPDGVVIFVGDHGLKLNNPDNSSKKVGNYHLGIDNFTIQKNIRYEFSVFNLLKVPKNYEKFLDSKLDTVNMTRLIISIINQESPKFAPKKHFILGYPGEKRFGKVTEVIME